MQMVKNNILEGRFSLILYVDDDGQTRKNPGTIMQISDMFIIFKDTKGKLILLPMARVLKIKEEGDGI